MEAQKYFFQDSVESAKRKLLGTIPQPLLDEAAEVLNKQLDPATRSQVKDQFIGVLVNKEIEIMNDYDSEYDAYKGAISMIAKYLNR